MHINFDSKIQHQKERSPVYIDIKYHFDMDYDVNLFLGSLML